MGDEVHDVTLPAVARDRLSACIEIRGDRPGPPWTGQRGRLTISGITQVVLAVGADAGIEARREFCVNRSELDCGSEVGEDSAVLTQAPFNR
ncbi:hypothetical protein [Nocardia sp. SC052]|uniref:hypothetical protein n=1 Tax=Nocardia sichangensis TaxID=3385975 RepID=UPI0039A155D0